MQGETGNSHEGDETEQKARPRHEASLRVLALASFTVACVLSIAAIYTAWLAMGIFDRTAADDEKYIRCEAAVDNLEVASDYLTSQSRMYVITGDARYLEGYLDEVNARDRRGEAVQTLRDFGGDNTSLTDLEEALEISNHLAQREIRAMRLAAESYGLAMMPADLAAVQLTAEEQALDADGKLALAEQLVLGAEYEEEKGRIADMVETATTDLIGTLHAELQASNENMQQRLTRLLAIVALLFAIVLLAMAFTLAFVIRPLHRYSNSITRGERLEPQGASELRYFADAYNVKYEESADRTLQLERAAETDALTGLKNRRAYDAYMAENHEGIALIVFDVDYFKSVNDRYGHDKGDAVLKRVAEAIRSSFRASDFISRIGGDEFTVVMTSMREDLRPVVVSRIQAVETALATGQDDLPPITLSIGAAFSRPGEGPEDVFRNADHALYRVKAQGRDNYAFAGDE